MKTAAFCLMFSALTMMGCSGAPASPDLNTARTTTHTAQTTAQAAAVQIFQTGWQPFGPASFGFNPCAGETVTGSGETSFRMMLTSDGSGGIHTSTHGVFRAHGVGDSTGANYVGLDVETMSENDFPSGAVDFTLVFFDKLIKVGSGAAGSFDLHSTIHLTIGSDGVLRSSVENFRDSGC